MAVGGQGGAEGIQPRCEYFLNLFFAVAAPVFLSTSHFIWRYLFLVGQPNLHEITG